MLRFLRHCSEQGFVGMVGMVEIDFKSAETELFEAAQDVILGWPTAVRIVASTEPGSHRSVLI